MSKKQERQTKEVEKCKQAIDRETEKERDKETVTERKGQQFHKKDMLKNK